MPELNRRLHILVNEEQFEYLRETAESRGIAVGELVRRAVESTYRPRADLRNRRAITELRKSAYIRESDWSSVKDRLSGPGRTESA